ncbi:PREDICTED: tensin-1 [Ceratosolen solmsi marchali]|uniref:Tensin-1 n=1 Tax=Ceratosolen solmsi marchali TaxID=326594 RepID=A0AAJ6YNI3_9HYME|nr:PREDICTED: tensin-1 [Ceratosolen solmsi marchali]
MPWIKCLGGGGGKTRRTKPLSVSQPIHLLVKNEFEPQCHVFRTKQLRRPRPCQLCHQAMVKQASCCRVCKYTCHKACEDKGARFRDTSQQIHKQWQADPARAFPTVGNVASIGAPVAITGDAASSSPHSTPSPSPSPTSSQSVTHNGSYESQPKNDKTLARNNKQQVLLSSTPPSKSQRTPGVGADSSTVACCKANGTTGGRVSEVMELCYVTERIIALWYREDARGVLEHATSLLRGKHANNYMIFNLSSAGRSGEPNTREVGWPQGLAPSLERLCALCKELDSWLNAATHRVVVLHARGGKERLGVAVSAYMNYSSICGGRDQALDRFAMRRFLDDKIGPLNVPSHRRYIEYFSGLLAGSLRISPSPLYLTHLTVLGVPMFEPTGCRAFFKVYEGLTPVYTSDLYSVTNAREFTVNLGGLRLRGDILVKCYHRIYNNQGREVMFSLQFHTCVITENVVSFPRSELDVACNDPRCPPDSVVTLYFANDPRRQDGPVPAPTPAIAHASAHHDPILHWDSYTNLELSDDEGRETPLSPPPASSPSVQTSLRGLGYTCGPIDGSLYAVVQQAGGGQGPGARGSPLTVSMDSGISSAPPQRQSPPELNEAENQAHGDLDKLLHDMMLTVESMPDPPNDDYNRPMRNGSSNMYVQEQPRNYNSQPSGSSAYSTLKDSYRSYSNSTAKESSPPYNSSSNCSTLKYNGRPSYDSVDYQRNSSDGKHNDSSFSPPGNIDYIDEDIPYHARQTSQPFSYGATNEMIKHQKLSSPSLVRKATARGAAPVVDLDDILGENGSRRPSSPLTPNTPDPPPEFANGPSIKPSDNEATNGMSWLKQQQLKLAARRDERSPTKLWRQESGNRMIGELKSVQRSRLRHDGYASDSAVLDDEDDVWTVNSAHGQISSKATVNTSAPASPLLPQRSVSRKLNGGVLLGGGSFQQSRGRAESVSERPFVAVKRAYEFRKYNDSHSPPLQKYNISGQPPRPESRSDSFARTESFLRDVHSRQLNSSLSSHSNGNHVAFDLDSTGSLASSSPRHPPSRPESRNHQHNGYHAHGNPPKKDTTGLLVMVDHQQQHQHQHQHQQADSADPLVSLIQSLAEIRPLSDSLVAAQFANTNSFNNGAIKAEQSLLLHTTTHQQSATIITVASNAINTYTTALNHSPKAWLSSITQSHNDSPSSWTERSISPGSVQGMSGGSASRPQTPAFPVHPRTPYVNNASSTVTFASDRSYQNHSTVSYMNSNNNMNNVEANNNNHNSSGSSSSTTSYGADRAIFIEERRDIRETGLPPKSPTTQRRLSFPDNGTLSEPRNKRWILTKQSTSFDYSKDRPVSPLDELISLNSYNRGPGTPTLIEYGQSPKSALSYTSINSSGQAPTQTQYYGSRRSSIHSNTEPHEVADANVKFVRDTSKIWYKPNISREQAIAMLRDASPGTFVVRDSNSFPGAFGLALKVATPPPGAPSSPKDPSSELVRHFLIEPTSRGVRLKGCANEPVFSSLSALVYQHSLMAMALPCQLLLPEAEAAARALDAPANSSPQQLLAQGAACNVLYLFTLDTESLTGPQAIKKTITMLYEQKPLPGAIIVHFKVSTQGITLTDNARKLFFRRHYPTNNISYCGLDTEERTWDFLNEETGRALSEHRCFGFVARKPAHKSDNQCHIFAELEPEQPATAIVNFVNKVMMGNAHVKANIV